MPTVKHYSLIDRQYILTELKCELYETLWELADHLGGCSSYNNPHIALSLDQPGL